jgi:hypothetical protein
MLNTRRQRSRRSLLAVHHITQITHTHTQNTRKRPHRNPTTTQSLTHLFTKLNLNSHQSGEHTTTNAIHQSSANTPMRTLLVNTSKHGADAGKLGGVLPPAPLKRFSGFDPTPYPTDPPLYDEPTIKLRQIQTGRASNLAGTHNDRSMDER